MTPQTYLQNLCTPKSIIFSENPQKYLTSKFWTPKKDPSLRMYENIRVPSVGPMSLWPRWANKRTHWPWTAHLSPYHKERMFTRKYTIPFLQPLSLSSGIKFYNFNHFIKIASDHSSYLLKLMFNLLIHWNKFNYSIYVFCKMCGKNLDKILPFWNHIFATLKTV